MKRAARRGLLGALLAGALPGTGASAEPLGFERDLRPVFERHCVECHSGWFPSGGLRLNRLENILAGGPSGPAVIPGRPDKATSTTWPRPCSDSAPASRPDPC